MTVPALSPYAGPGFPGTAAPAAALARARPDGAGDPETVRKTAEDFASFFLTQSFETMYQGIGSDPLLGGGSGEQMFRSLLVQEYGKVAAQAGGLGLADTIQREMIHLQEVR